MAIGSSLDLVNQGNKSLRSGIQNLGGALERRGERVNRQEEKDAIAEAEGIRQERLTGILGKVEQFNAEVADPNSTLTPEEISRRQSEITQESVDSGNLDAIRALTPTAKLIEDRKKEVKQGKIDEKDKKKGAREDFKALKDTRKLFRSNKITLNTGKLRESYGKIEKASKQADGPGDLALVFNFMKMLDPGSVVRESEFKTAAGAKGFFTNNVEQREDGQYYDKRNKDPEAKAIPSFLVSTFQKFDANKGGAFLTPDQRDRFVTTSRGAFRSQLGLQKDQDRIAIEDADTLQIDPSRIISRRASDDLDALDKAEGITRDADGNRINKDADPLNTPAQPPAEEFNPHAAVTQDEEIPKEAQSKVISQEAFIAFASQPHVEAAFEAAVVQENAVRAQDGLPPMSEEEEQSEIRRVLKSKGIVVQSGGGSGFLDAAQGGISGGL